MDFFIKIIYLINFVGAFYAFIWMYDFYSRIDFLSKFTSRSQRYRKTGIEMDLMQFGYRFLFSALPVPLILLPSILIYDYRSEDFNLESYFSSDKKEVEALSAEEHSKQILETIETDYQKRTKEANKSQ